MRSLLLTGSVARDEATIVAHPGGWRILGDADFIVVLERHAPLPTGDAVATLTAQCESELRAAGVVTHVGMAAVHDDYFAGSADILIANCIAAGGWFGRRQSSD